MQKHLTNYSPTDYASLCNTNTLLFLEDSNKTEEYSVVKIVHWNAVSKLWSCNQDAGFF